MNRHLNEKLDALRDELELALEGRGMRVGTVRKWKGGHYQKTDTGWVPVKAGVRVTKPVGNAPHAIPTAKQGKPVTTMTNFGPKMGTPPKGVDDFGRMAWAAGAEDPPEDRYARGQRWLAQLRKDMEQNHPWLLPADHPLKIAYHAKQAK